MICEGKLNHAKIDEIYTKKGGAEPDLAGRQTARLQDHLGSWRRIGTVDELSSQTRRGAGHRALCEQLDTVRAGSGTELFDLGLRISRLVEEDKHAYQLPEIEPRAT